MTCGALIMPKDLGLELALMADTTPPTLTPPRWERSLEDTERHHIEQGLASVRGTRAHAARLLEISIPTLYKKMRKYSVETVDR
jgi:DNA-binding NtrC family response regulator